MPLVKRLIEPVYIGRTILHKQVKNELEGVTINSLAGVIKQLSSISKHAEDLFGDLVNEAGSIYRRSTALGQRVQTLYEKTSQLDSAVKEDVKVEEFSVMSHFKSRRQEEQQVLTPNTLPQALKEVYSSCDEPPKLNKFTPYRDDNKDGIKFYTDRNYFYDLWVQQQYQLLKDRKKKGDKRRRRKRRENNPAKKIHGVKKKSYASVDKEFVTADVHREPDLVTSTPAPGPPLPSVQESRPVNGPPPSPAPPSHAQLSAPTAPPPPPPPAVESTGIIPPPPPPVDNSPSFQHTPVAPFPYAAPPPPPPPVAVQFGGPPAPPPPPVTGMPAPPPPPMAGPPPPPPPGPAQPFQAPPAAVKTPELDPRRHLLTAIEMGKNLRKVERNDEVKKQVYGSDVASILKRRIVMEVSDTESESGSDSSGSWSED